MVSLQKKHLNEADWDEQLKKHEEEKPKTN